MPSVLQAEDLGLAGRLSQGEEGVKYEAGKIHEIVFDVLRVPECQWRCAMAEAEGHETSLCTREAQDGNLLFLAHCACKDKRPNDIIRQHLT